ncbi:MAG: phosphoribosylformylglycinamidine cyclo-ligase [Candidatus Aenigmarchaeota archaeon]|nr:phosphoribosylformylglycinamidine cyclo-ligase [Candidatus Aenigmarchaeota archaeon]
MNYASAGVDRDKRRKAKSLIKIPKNAVKTPYNLLYKTLAGYQVKTSDGAGTKVLLSELAGKHGTIGIDAVAMVANDCIRSGATPVALTDIIDVRESEPTLIRELLKGVEAGAKQAGCPVVGGEIADVPELLKSAYQINCDCVGDVQKKEIIWGRVKAGDAVVGLPSSGLHSNGISLARKTLFREWRGAYDAYDEPMGFDRPLIEEALEPTRIYVKELAKIRKRVQVKAAVHITGDAYLKFLKLGKGFEFFSFQPQQIFRLINTFVATDEMFRTFNMGWGFAVVVDEKDADTVGETIGRVSNGNKIRVDYNGKRFIL